MILAEALRQGSGACRGSRHADEGQTIVWPNLDTERRIFSWPRNPGPRTLEAPEVERLHAQGWTDWVPITPEQLT